MINTIISLRNNTGIDNYCCLGFLLESAASRAETNSHPRKPRSSVRNWLLSRESVSERAYDTVLVVIDV